MTTDTTPRVGDPATYVVWTDTHACTVIAVSKDGKRATLQRDVATVTNAEECRKNGQGWPCEYDYSRDPNGETYEVSLRSNGQWKRVGQTMKEPGGYAFFGRRQEYYDPHF
jgi:hypothetical protein